MRTGLKEELATSRVSFPGLT